MENDMPDMPPPGHPKHDLLLRMIAARSSRPDGPNVLLERFMQEVRIERPVATSTSHAPSPVQALSPPQNASSLELLHQKLVAFFLDGTQEASIKFTALRQVALEGRTHVPKLDYLAASAALGDIPLPWNSCKLTASLVLILAAPKDSEVMHSALKLQSTTLGGLPTMAMINSTPSADLAARFARAKKAALDRKVGKVTVLAVSLVDVEMIERGESGKKPMDYSSFAHTFVLGIAREGWRIFQAWGEHEYTLDEYFDCDGARLRDWKEAKSFVKAFGVLASAEGSWSQAINDKYQECFEVDVLRICGKDGSQRPIVPVYRPWVRMFEFEHVKVVDIEKFTWGLS